MVLCAGVSENLIVTTENVSAPLGKELIDGPYAWLRLAVSVALGTIGSIGFWGVVVILPAVQTEFGVDRSDASMPYTLTMLGFAAGNVLIGRYVDRLGIVIPIITAAVAMGLGFVGAAVVSDIWLFALLQGLFIGIGTAASFGPLIADVSHWFIKRRGVAVALCACGNYIGGTIWPLVVQALMDANGWRFHLCGDRSGRGRHDGAVGIDAAPAAAARKRIASRREEQDRYGKKDNRSCRSVL